MGWRHSASDSQNLAAEGIAATVSTVAYEGERYALKLAVETGQHLHAFSHERIQPGERVRLVISSAWRL